MSDILEPPSVGPIFRCSFANSFSAKNRKRTICITKNLNHHQNLLLTKAVNVYLYVYIRLSYIFIVALHYRIDHLDIFAAKYER